ncbi:peptidylprolyl isomerase [Sphingomicrobium nitratireducens]|uniref:peptidylprolyl isomerase n=1 Tax=Sphingomicrobium nitratireducens TaxID=2964666 RepID=UPI00223F5FCC|nr:peptidylprolyl isomerase [Sphingomicrobium nitratireducens]
MLSSFRNLSKSTVGTIILGIFLLLIVASFALADLSNFTSGGGSADSLASAGDEKITDKDLSDALQQRLSQVRQVNPEADYSDLAGEFDAILQLLLEDRALNAFADDNGFVLSKRLVDAEIARIPAARGLDGKFSEEAYQAFLAQQRMTDGQVRKLLAGDLLRRFLITPATAEVRVPTGFATPYASMLLEEREGQIALVPTDMFQASLKPTAEQVAAYYRNNGARYTVPEQRVLRIAPIGAPQVAAIVPTDAEIEKALKDRAAEFSSREIRVISQVVLGDKAAADKVAAAARTGSFVDAVSPEGYSAADVSVGPQDKDQFADLASDKVADAVFASGVAGGSVVGPIRSDLGWHVVKVDSVRTEGGVSPGEARAKVAAELTEEKRKEALIDLVTRIEDMVLDGASFAEAVKQFDLEVVQTPLITASGRARSNPDYSFPARLRTALEAGFAMEADDEPVIETLADKESFAMVVPEDVVEAAPAPLAEIRDQVAKDWTIDEAMKRARTIALKIQKRVAGGASPADAVAAVEKEEGISLPPTDTITLRRIQLTQMGEQVPPPVQMLFNLAEGKSQLAADPEGRGIFIVKAAKVTPGNALTSPGLVTQTAESFRQPLASEIGQQLLAAMKKDVGTTRNEKAIAATRSRIIGDDN